MRASPKSESAASTNQSMASRPSFRPAQVPLHSMHRVLAPRVNKACNVSATGFAFSSVPARATRSTAFPVMHRSPVRRPGLYRAAVRSSRAWHRRSPLPQGLTDRRETPGPLACAATVFQRHHHLPLRRLLPCLVPGDVPARGSLGRRSAREVSLRAQDQRAVVRREAPQSSVPAPLEAEKDLAVVTELANGAQKCVLYQGLPISRLGCPHDSHPTETVQVGCAPISPAAQAARPRIRRLARSLLVETATGP